MMKKLILIIYVLSITVFSAHVNAALFDDTEARKKILDVEAKMQSQDAAAQAQIDALKKNQQELEAIVKGQGLADMLNQIEVLNHEIAKLKGDLELANHQIAVMEQREKDLYVDTDGRLRKLEEINGAKAASPAESGSANASSTANEANNQELKLLQDADGLAQAGKHKEAFAAYDKFLKEHPDSELAADALYGLGASQYSLKNYKSAILTQQKLIDLHPKSKKVPDALMSMASAQIQLGQVQNAKKSYQTLVEQFPESELVPTANKRLKTLSAIK